MSSLARLLASAQKPSRLALGLMSGMSRDGLDMALVRIAGSGDARRQVDLVAARTVSYDADLQARLRDVLQAPPAEVAAVDFDLGELWALDVLAFLQDLDVEAGDIDVVGSHGQTVSHRPRGEETGAATLQIGQADILAERLGVPVVSDFRPRDIAAGGEGAPLIPLVDWLLYASTDETVACHNLGSIANVSVLPRADAIDARLRISAFDTGPANALIDAFASDVDESGMDLDGRVSAGGHVDDDLLLALYTRRARWLRQVPPKSAGYGTFGPRLAGNMRQRFPHMRPADRVRTAVEFTAQTMRDAYEWHVLPHFPDLARIRLSGGGCRNPTLMACIQEKFRNLPLAVESLDPVWSDAKEAVGFALLADETIQGRAGNVPGATGAGRGVALGKISLA